MFAGPASCTFSRLKGEDRCLTPEWVLDGFPEEVDAVARKIYADFNEEHGTDYEFQLKK